MKVALVHDYLVQSGGAERVILALHRLFPDAPIYTTIADPALVKSLLPDADVRTSWMQRLPGHRRHFRKYFLLYPSAVESLDLREYDLVISNSSAFAKGVRTRPDACHVCYCHTPMRFAWDFPRYAAQEGWNALTHRMLIPMVERVRQWDLRTSRRPTVYLANSSNIARRIDRCYGLPSRVVYPAVDVTRFRPSDVVGDYHLVVSRLVGYKRVDLAVAAFTKMGRNLVVVGDGPVRGQLEQMAGPTIRFLGRIPDDEVARHYSQCQALIFPGEEDFGLTPLEANASGRPVIAFAGGGALDSVIDGITGMLFPQQTVESLEGAVRRSDEHPWESRRLRAHAENFSEDVFRETMGEAIRTAVRESASRSGCDFDDRQSVRDLQGDRVQAFGGPGR